MDRGFEKWHANQNDFILFSLHSTESELIRSSIVRQVETLCNRAGLGIGADGVIVRHFKGKDDLFPRKIEVFNRDGGQAKNCGNGLRCVALSAYHAAEKKGRPLEGFDLEFAGRTYSFSFFSQKEKGAPYVAVDMGELATLEQLSWWDEFSENIKGKDLNFERVFAAEIGNPHVVFFVNESPESLDLNRIAAAANACVPIDGVNVSIVNSVDAAEYKMFGKNVSEQVSVRVHERGVGETACCGSAACAIAKGIFAEGFVGEDELCALTFPGGKVFCALSEPSITLIGSATPVFAGTWDL